MQAEKGGKNRNKLAQGMKREICLSSKKGRETGRSDLQTEKRKNRGQNARFLKERQVRREMFHSSFMGNKGKRGSRDEKRGNYGERKYPSFLKERSGIRQKDEEESFPPVLRRRGVRGGHEGNRRRKRAEEEEEEARTENIGSNNKDIIQ